MLDFSKLEFLRKEWAMNKARIATIPKLDDEILKLLLERAEANVEEHGRDVMEIAKTVARSSNPEEVASALVDLIASAERRRMALLVERAAKEEMAKRGLRQ